MSTLMERLMVQPFLTWLFISGTDIDKFVAVSGEDV